MSEGAALTGRRRCGAVSWRAPAPMLWAALRHCGDCRRAASSDYVSWFGVRRAETLWSGPRAFYTSSEKVVHSFCGTCGAPHSFETDIFPDETDLYAATIDDAGAYRPTAHIFWSERLPWVRFDDALPKHPKGLQHAAGEGGSLLE